jgi:hypothetical protein
MGLTRRGPGRTHLTADRGLQGTKTPDVEPPPFDDYYIFFADIKITVSGSKIPVLGHKCIVSERVNDPS